MSSAIKVKPKIKPKIKPKKVAREVAAYIVLIIVGVVMCYPLLWMFFASFKSNNAEIFTGVNLLPNEFYFDSYREGWEFVSGTSFAVFFKNSFMLAVPTTILTVVSSAFVAFGFARFEFPGKKILFTVLLATLMLPNSILIIPRFAIFRDLNVLDSYWPFYLLAAFACYPFFTYMLVQFTRGLPRELDEAAYIDGCGSFQVLTLVLLPLLKPALFSAGLFQFLWTYNDFFNSLIYINTMENYTVPLAIRSLLSSEVAVGWNSIMAMSFLAVLPVIILFFFCQKYFVEGIATTGLKG